MYLDSAILVKLVMREPDSDFYVDLVDGQSGVVSSELAIVECRSALLRKWEKGLCDARTCRSAWTHLQALWSDSGALGLRPVSLHVLREAGEIMHRCMRRAPLRSLDAIHLATLMQARAYPLVTNDIVMRSAAGVLGLPLSSLPA